MPSLTILNIAQIPGIALTPDLARRFNPSMSDAHAQDLIETAQHEAAHLVAALACCAAVLSISIAVRHTVGRPAGKFCDATLLPVHDVFIWLAGFMWERSNGDELRAADDLSAAKELASLEGIDFDELYLAADQFVETHAKAAIRDAAVGILMLSTKQGVLKGTRLRELKKWLAEQIPSLPRCARGAPN